MSAIMLTILGALTAAVLALATNAFWRLLRTLKDLRENKVSRDEFKEKMGEVRESVSKEIKNNYEKIVIMQESIKQAIASGNAQHNDNIKQLTSLISSFFTNR